jgi:hypothetical protein
MNPLEKDFVPYIESLKLKEVGFNEPCIAGYSNSTEKLEFYSRPLVTKDSFTVDAPTFSQAFKFFREKYGYDCSFEDELVYDDDDKEIEMWDFFIYKTKQASVCKKMTFCSNNHDTYVESFCREEAELACLRKLIQIVKNK